jgi:hypothetical protein
MERGLSARLAVATVALGKALLGGGHVDRLFGDDLGDDLELLGGVVHLRDALFEARLLGVVHRVGKLGACKLDQPAAAAGSHCCRRRARPAVKGGGSDERSGA